MTMDMDRFRSQARNRFGQLSKNMFFARHVAQPRYLGFINGTAGQRVCHVREAPLQLSMPLTNDFSTSLMSDPRFNIEFASNSQNETLLQSYNERIRLKHRRERLLPPLPGWNPTGTVVEDTENWRRELARIAETVGLVTSDELLDIESRKETPLTPAIKVRPLTGQYSRQTGRWNETPKTGNRTRSARRRTPLSSIVPNHLFCVDDQEREMWMLQVLCQILQTESLTEIQSWLVSSGPSEKEAVRQLITTAIKGLEDNGRIQASVCLDDNVKGTQVNMDTFGSLLAAKFPVVSSISSINENTTRPPSRPRTAPPLQRQLESKADVHNKTIGTIQTNLQSIDENTETTSGDITTTELPPVTFDLTRDVQILTLNDDDAKVTQSETTENNGLAPF